MSLKLNERYPGRFSNPSTQYPQGAFKNRTAPGAQDGSYLEKDWANDMLGFLSRLLTVANITPNGNVDTALSSQYFDAMIQSVKNNLGTTAQRNVGNAASDNIPDMSFFTSGAGWYKLPNGQIFQFGQSSIVNSTTGVATATFPIAFPTECDTILITEVTNTGGPTFVRSWGLDVTSVTLSGFSGQLNATGGAVTGEFFRFFAMGK